MGLDLYWSIYFFTGNFNQCFYVGQLLYGDVVILTTSMVVMLCYVSHSVCSQVYYFSIEHRLITSMERKIKDYVAITIFVLTFLLLVAWWIVNAVN
jgi:hypothetical protein